MTVKLVTKDFETMDFNCRMTYCFAPTGATWLKPELIKMTHPKSGRKIEFNHYGYYDDKPVYLEV